MNPAAFKIQEKWTSYSIYIRIGQNKRKMMKSIY